MLVPTSVGLLIYAVVIYDRRLIDLGMAMILLTVIVVVAQWLVAGRTQCPLCMTPVLATKNCNKHRHARAVFGSHRLRVALAVLFTNSFRCPYCHEPTELRVRERGRQYANPGS